jgi:hypothetical protein
VSVVLKKDLRTRGDCITPFSVDAYNLEDLIDLEEFGDDITNMSQLKDTHITSWI